MATTALRPDPLLLVTASMGAGHTRAAGELAARLSGRMPVETVDLLEVLPGRIGTALRSGYQAMVRRTPWLYEAIFQAYFVPKPHWQPSVSPLVRLAARRLRHLVARRRPCAVVSTFHLAGQAVGLLRQRGWLSAPSVVVVTEPAGHALWSHPGTDLFVCPYPWVADDVHRATGRPAVAPGPIVGAEFDHDRAPEAGLGRRRLGLRPGEHAVLVAGGSWGVGDLTAVVDELMAVPSVRPVVLCGQNTELRRRLDRKDCVALGWRTDLPVLFAAAGVLVDNAGGTTCAEAFAAGLPVVGHRPLPGHGRVGVHALIRAGLVADGRSGLRSAVGALCLPGPVRRAQCGRAARVFRADPADVLADWLADTGVPIPHRVGR